jgi:carboxyl-terminal processing protease
MLRKFTLISIILISALISFPLLAQEEEQAVEQVEKAEQQEEESRQYERDDVYHQLELFSTALSYILMNYCPTEGIDDGIREITEKEVEDAMNGAIKGMLQGLGDRYSFYQPKSRRKREQENLFYAKFGGLGIRILPSPDGFVSIVQPMEGTPAMKAGLHSGDKIVAVDGESIKDKSIEDVVDILRGEVGTDVTITIIRQGNNVPFDVTITRGIINFPSVRHVMMDDKIGYIAISSFTAKTPEELKESIDKLIEDGMRGLVLDLRNNTGGMMSAAVAVSNAFLEEGVIVSTDGKLDRFDSVYRAEKDKVMCPMDMPLVVLVNENSASGSEIVAGAIKDYERGLIVGKKTFGKGVVQQRFPLDEHRAVSITVSIYKTPDGNWIHKEGIEPNVDVENPKILEGVDDETLKKFYEGEYIDKFVYEYLEKHPDQSPEEQFEALKEKTPELMKKLADDGIEISEKIVKWYVQRTFASTKYIPNIDLENDVQLATAVEELEKQIIKQE